MRIVLDTNVLVSALLTPHGPAARILDLILLGEIQLVFDDRIIAEYREVLARERFGFNPTYIEDLIAFIEMERGHLTATSLKCNLPDPHDLPFLECALAGKVNYLVTGNKKHFPQGVCRGVEVVSPTEFLDCWAKG